MPKDPPVPFEPSAPVMRYECVKPPHFKFWEVQRGISGKVPALRVSYGRMYPSALAERSAARSLTHLFGSTEERHLKMDALIHEKTGKGYKIAPNRRCAHCSDANRAGFYEFRQSLSMSNGFVLCNTCYADAPIALREHLRALFAKQPLDAEAMNPVIEGLSNMAKSAGKAGGVLADLGISFKSFGKDSTMWSDGPPPCNHAPEKADHDTSVSLLRGVYRCKHCKIGLGLLPNGTPYIHDQHSYSFVRYEQVGGVEWKLFSCSCGARRYDIHKPKLPNVYVPEPIYSPNVIDTSDTVGDPLGEFMKNIQKKVARKHAAPEPEKPKTTNDYLGRGKRAIKLED